MPRRLRSRLAWLDALEYAVAVDVAATYTELRGGGWTAEGAAEVATAGFVRWLAARLEDAAGIGLAFALAGDEEAV